VTEKCVVVVVGEEKLKNPKQNEIKMLSVRKNKRQRHSSGKRRLEGGGGRPNGVGVETAQGRELRHASAKIRKRISVFVLKERERERV
jgi:hypothetical protein